MFTRPTISDTESDSHPITLNCLHKHYYGFYGLAQSIDARASYKFSKNNKNYTKSQSLLINILSITDDWQVALLLAHSIIRDIEIYQRRFGDEAQSGCVHTEGYE